MKTKQWAGLTIGVLALGLVLGFFFFPRIQAWQLEKTILKEIIPQAEKYLGQETGHSVNISIGRLEVANDTIIITNPILVQHSQPPLRLRARKLILTKLERTRQDPRKWVASGRLEGLTGQIRPQNEIKVQSLTLEEVRKATHGRGLFIGRSLAQDVKITAEYSLAASSVDIQDLILNEPRHLQIGQLEAMKVQVGHPLIQRYELDRLSWQGMDWPDVQEPATMTSDSGEIQGLTAYFMGRRVIHLGHFSQKSQTDNGSRQTEMTFKQAQPDIGQLPVQAKGWMEQYGIARMSFDGRLAYLLNRPARKFSLIECRVWSDDLGRLELGLDLGNFFWDERDFMGSLDRLRRDGTLLAARLAYSDQTLVRRLLQKQAHHQGVSLSKYKSMLTANLEGLKELYPQPELTTLLGAVQKFIMNPGWIEISAKPAEPLPLAGLRSMGFDQALAALGLMTRTR